MWPENPALALRRPLGVSGGCATRRYVVAHVQRNIGAYQRFTPDSLMPRTNLLRRRSDWEIVGVGSRAPLQFRLSCSLDSPQSFLSCATRTNRASISSSVRADPVNEGQFRRASGDPLPVPSQRSLRSGQCRRPPQEPFVPTFWPLRPIFNDLQLAVVHPHGDGDQLKPEWVEHFPCIQTPLSRRRAIVK